MRCFGDGNPLYERYHDEEWGVPVRDERGLLERISLEAFQSGLAWITILRKREAFRAAFAGFDPEAVARFGEADVERLLADEGIVRNRAKIEATIANARATLALRQAGTPLEELVWSFAPPPRATRVASLAELPVAEAAHQVVVDEPGGLHEGVADRRPDELEAAAAEVFAHGARLVGFGG